jgi:hypothetical protein
VVYAGVERRLRPAPGERRGGAHGAVQRYRPDRRGARSGSIRFDTVGSLLEPGTGGPWSFQDLAGDAEGNVYVGARVGGGLACFSARRTTGRMERVLADGWLARQLARADGDLGPRRVRLRPAPTGEVWVLVGSTLTERLEAAYVVERRDGAWTPRRVALQVGEEAPGDPRDALEGTPDWWGGLVFTSGAAVWRIDGDGQVRPLIRFSLQRPGAWLTQPVALPGGDLWVGSPRAGAAPDEPAWLKLRFGVELELGAITGEALAAGLEASGRVAPQALPRVDTLAPDYAEGGLVARDVEGGVLFSVLPE